MRLVCVVSIFENNTGLTDRRSDRRMDKRTDGRTDQRTDGPTDMTSYRDATAHLKTEKKSEKYWGQGQNGWAGAVTVGWLVGCANKADMV